MFNQIKTFGLLSILTGILLGVGFFLGGISGAFTALIFAGIINFASYWYSDKIILGMHGAEEVPEEENPTLHRIVSNLSEKAEMPKPRVYKLNTGNPNALATGRNPENSAIAVTKGLTENLSPEEVEGVISHEISHIKNRDTLISTISATIAGAVTWIAHVLSFTLLFGGRERGNAGGAVFMMLFAPLAATLVRLAISRNREFIADSSGAKLTEKPHKLSSALKKIHKVAESRPLNINPSASHLFIANPIKKDFLLKLFSTHPPLEERLENLEKIKI